MLRECLVARTAEAAAALRAAGPGMSREGMRYALEKCPDARLREELMALAGSRAEDGGGGGEGGGGGAEEAESDSSDKAEKTQRARKADKAGKEGQKAHKAVKAEQAEQADMAEQAGCRGVGRDEDGRGAAQVTRGVSTAAPSDKGDCDGGAK